MVSGGRILKPFEHAMNCGMKLGVAGGTLYLDFGFFKEGALAAREGVNLMRATNLLTRSQLTNMFRRNVSVSLSESTFAALSTAAKALMKHHAEELVPEYEKGIPLATAATLANNGHATWKDWVPGFATWNAGKDAFHYCAGKTRE
jgi:hypothetical protein